MSCSIQLLNQYKTHWHTKNPHCYIQCTLLSGTQQCTLVSGTQQCTLVSGTHTTVRTRACVCAMMCIVYSSVYFLCAAVCCVLQYLFHCSHILHYTRTHATLHVLYTTHTQRQIHYTTHTHTLRHMHTLYTHVHIHTTLHAQ